MRLVIATIVILILAPFPAWEARQDGLLSASYAAEPGPVQGGTAASKAPPQDIPVTQEPPVPSPEVKADGPAGGTVVTYSAKEIFEKADKVVDRANTTLNIILGLTAILVGVLIFLVERWNRRHRNLEKEFADLRSRQKSHSTNIKDVKAVVEKSAEDARQVSSRLQIGLLAHMDSDAERTIMDRWIKQTESDIGINELENLVNNLDMFHPFDFNVFAHLGHYYRYQAQSFEHNDLQQVYYKIAQSYYFRAIRRKPDDPIKRSDLHVNAAICQQLLGEYLGCLDSVETAIAIRSYAGHSIHSILYQLKGYALMYLESHARAEEAYNAAMATAENRPRVLYNLACNNALWGDHLSREGDKGKEKHQAALKLLRRLTEHPIYRARARKDPDFEGLRRHPELGRQFHDWAGAE